MSIKTEGSGWHVPTMEEVEVMVRLHKARSEARRREYLEIERLHEIQYQQWLMDEKVRQKKARIWQRKQAKIRAEAKAREAAEAAEREARKQARLAKLAANPPPPPVSIEAQRRSRVDWAEYLGNEMVAARQVAWERNTTILRMHEAGLSYRAIGEKIGLCRGRVQQLEQRAVRDRKNGRRSPAEEFMAMPLLITKAPGGKKILPQAVARDWLIITGSGG